MDDPFQGYDDLGGGAYAPSLPDNRNANNAAQTNSIGNIFDTAVRGVTSFFGNQSEQDRLRLQSQNLQTQRRISAQNAATYTKLGLIGGAIVVVILLVLMFRK